jgi:peptide/nickel transport system substrate-binding protein
MKVKTEALQISGVIKRLNSGKWQSTMGIAGAWDPAVGVGVAFSFASTSPFTGVNDAQLNSLFEQAIATADAGQRDRLYQKIAKLISDKAYGMFGFPLGTANLAVKGVFGPGLTTKIPALFINPGIIWSEVWSENS